MVSLLTLTPDLPEWVEARGSLLAGRAAAIAAPAGGGVLLRVDEDELLILAGDWQADGLTAALAEAPAGFALLVQDAQAGLLAGAPGWEGEPATIYTLAPSAMDLWPVDDHEVALLGPHDARVLGGVPDDLREELERALARSAVAAALDGTRPVAFCYAGGTTETLADLSVDTLEPWRRRGFGQAASRAMIRHLAERRLRPVWGATESNVPSHALARRLGFVPASRLWVFARDE